LAGLIGYLGSGWLAKRKERKSNQAPNFHSTGGDKFSNAGDDKFYDEVARELQEKSMVPGLWTKAFAEMGGDDAKARALYIRYRVLQLRDKQIENTRLQAKEARLAAEAAKPPLSKLEKSTISILTMLIGFVTLILIISTIGCIFDKENFIDTDATYGDTIPFVLGLGVLAFVCGWITRKGYKAATR
jgi:hypothetical protein